MRVTIGICTWNRAKVLDQTLACMQELVIPPGVDWELLVVNNNCTDQTDAVISRHADQLPIRRLYEATPGKSNALNTATRAVGGELILWTDDDVLVERNWLAEYVAAAAAFPDASFFGGPIQPVFDGVLPSWLRQSWQHLGGAYGSLDLGDEPRGIDENTLPYGANCAIRAQVQRCYPYQPGIGRKARARLTGEETLLFRQLLADGHCGRWVPKARLRHYVPRSHLTIDYLRAYFYGAGQTDATMNNDCLASQSRRMWRRAGILCRAVVREAKYRLYRRIAGPKLWTRHLARSSYHWGYLSVLSRRGATFT